MTLVTETPMTLEQLLEQVTEGNIHREVDSGPAAGEEVWRKEMLLPSPITLLPMEFSLSLKLP